MKQFLPVFLFVLFSGLLSIPVEGQSPQPEVFTPSYFDISPPLRDVPITAPYQKDTMTRNPGLRVRHYPYEATALPQGPDEAWQKEMGTWNPVDGPTLNFAGVNNRNGAIPPDTQGDVGPDHYFQVVNVSFQIWDKLGNSVYGPADIANIWSGFNPSSLSDPIVLYDEYSDRWFVSIFKASSPYKIYIAVSQTSDPTGSWYRWVYDWATKPDYAKYSVWRDGYYYASNTGGGKDVGVFERSVMISGGASPKLVTFTNPNRPAAGFHSIMPLDNDGTLSPSGTPGTFITINDDAWGGSDQLWIYNLSVNWSNTALSTFSRVQQVNVTAFNSNFGPNWDNIAQPGTAQELDAVPEVLMYRAQYRNFGTHQTIVCCHSVDVDNTDHAGVRWYELRKTGASWTLYQQSTYAPDAHSRWMGSISMNGVGDIALGYSVSSSTVYPSIRFTGRKASDPLNSMTMTETSIFAGTASQTGWNRWGDYSCMNVDPEDDIRFWFTTEHSNGGADWRTRIAAFSFSEGCYASGGCDEYISRVQVGTIDNSTACINYGDYTLSHSTSIPINGSRLVTVTNGNGYAADQCGVWVDWNRDGDFYDANESIAVTGSPGLGPYTARIVAPSNLTYGDLTLRIRITYTGAVDPCGTTQYGEVEDYTLTVSSPVLTVWTGAVDHNWHNAGNWNHFHVPYPGDDVYIAAGTPNECWIWTFDAECDDLTIQTGTYLRNYDKLLTVNGNLYIDGQLMMDNPSPDADIYVSGNVFWRSGSTAWLVDGTNIWTYGNMEFAAGSNVQVNSGGMLFLGTLDSYIRNYSPATQLNIVGSYKTGGALFGFSGLSDQPITFNGDLYVHTGAKFSIYSGQPLTVKGNIFCNGDFSGNSGTTVVLDGTSQTIMPYTTTFFHNLTFSQSGTVTISNSYSTILDINNNVLIESGIFNAGSNTIQVGGNWTNNAGPAAFNEGTSRVVFNGSAHQIVKTSETFNILEASMGAALRVDNAASVVTCNQYDWTSGGIDVLAGTFTALDLYDNGIYGGYWLNAGGTINLTNDGWIDLNGSLNIYGGNFNVYGGSVNSDWPYSSNASITMSDGVLDFKNRGIRVYSTASFTLTENITGGTIRTVGGFENQRSDFTPTNNTIELYGTTDAYLLTSTGCSVFSVNVNKGADDDGLNSTALYDREGKIIPETKSNTVFAGTSPLTILGNLTINSGIFDLNGSTVNVTNTVSINAATLKMISASDKLNANYISWNAGSNDNVTNGIFDAYIWSFNEGTNAQLGTGNTAYLEDCYWPADSDAEFGNLVVTPYSKAVHSDNGKAIYPYRVAGNLLVQAGVLWPYLDPGMIVAGNTTIENTASISFPSGADFTVGGSLTLAGTLGLTSGSIATVAGDFIFPNTGTLNAGAGSFINSYSTGSASLGGTLQLTSGAVEFPNRNVAISSSFNDQISGGTIRLGRTLNANTAGTFEPSGGVVEFINASSGNYVQVTNGNYLYHMTLNKPGSSYQVYDNLTIKGNLVIDAGVLNSFNKTITIAGDWMNNVGVSAFDETNGRVIFNGTGTQFCSTENFYILEVNKPGRLYNVSYSTINCQIYDWTSGGLWISPGNFSAADLADNGLYGEFGIFTGVMVLYQDAAQYVDVNGNITVGSGGTLNIYGGNGASWWSYGGNATVTMNGGTLDFKNNGVIVHQSGTYTFAENITGGTVRTPGIFSVENAAFTPTGGTVEFYGNQMANINHVAGANFYNVTLNKVESDDQGDKSYKERDGKEVLLSKGTTLTLFSDVLINGNLTVNTGTLDMNNMGHDLTVTGNVAINNGGFFDIWPMSYLKLNSSLTVNSGGSFVSHGTLGTSINITRAATSRYTFNVLSGGNFGADYTIFEFMGAGGINIANGATVNAASAFNNCTFREGLAGNTLLTMNSAQDVTSTGAIFPANTWGGTHNVTKSVNAGRITFRDYSGAFSGPAFENDPNSRVDWFVPQLSANPTVLNVTPPAGTTSFDVISNTSWTLSESTSWFSISASSGTGNATITVTYDQNASSVARNGTITLSAPGASDVTITVNQAGAALSVAPAIRNVTAAAGTTTFDVTSNTVWTASESVSWFSIWPAGGTGNGTVTVTYDQNLSVSPRNGSITFTSPGLANVVVSVSQAGAGVILTVTPSNRDVAAPAGTTTFSITSNTGWTVSESVSWFSVLPLSGTGNGTITVTYGENATGSTRAGNLAVTASGGSPSATVSVTQVSYPTHNIALTEGWQGLSSYIQPVNNDIVDVFAPVAGQFIMAQTMDLMYYPAGGVNTIGDWLSQSAYKLKMNAPASLPITGIEVSNKAYGLAAGWNLVPVICNTNVNIASLTGGLGANLQIVKEIAGSRVYWPSFGIYTLENMVPGSAYFVRMAAAGMVTFPANSDQSAAVNYEPVKEYITPWNALHRSASSHITGFTAEAIRGFSEGDIMGVFNTQGYCAGMTEIKDLSENLVLYAFGDDALTPDQDGFIQGDPLIFRIYRPSTGELFGLDVMFDAAMPDSEGVFAAEGISGISAIYSVNTGVGDEISAGLYVYPNPAHSEITVGGLDGILEIQILGADGASLLQQDVNHPGDIRLSLGKFPAGIYQLRIKTGLGIIIRKVVKR